MLTAAAIAVHGRPCPATTKPEHAEDCDRMTLRRGACTTNNSPQPYKGNQQYHSSGLRSLCFEFVLNMDLNVHAKFNLDFMLTLPRLKVYELSLNF